MRWDDVTVLTLLKKTLAPSALCASQASRADQSAALTYKLPAYLCRLFSKRGKFLGRRKCGGGLSL